MDLSTEFIIKEEIDFPDNDGFLEFNYEDNVKFEFDEAGMVNKVEDDEDQELTSYEELKNACKQLCVRCFRVFPCRYSLLKHNLTHLRIYIDSFSMPEHKTILHTTEDGEICNKHTLNEKNISKRNCKEDTSVLKLNCKENRTKFKLNYAKGILNEEYKCHICDKLLSYKGLFDHIRNVHTERSYICGSCNKMFTARKYLLNHIRYVHQNVTEQKCSLCPSVFTNQLSMKHHLKFFHSDIVTCELCQSRMKRANLVTHMRRMHNKNGKTHRCDWCAKIFKSPYYLRRHLKNSRCGS